MQIDYTKIDERTKSEASIFWSRIAKYLPKSIERSALGDEKIYNAFFVAYTEFRPHLISLSEQSLLERVEKVLTEQVVSLGDDSANRGYMYAINDVKEYLKSLKHLPQEEVKNK